MSMSNEQQCESKRADLSPKAVKPKGPSETIRVPLK